MCGLLVLLLACGDDSTPETDAGTDAPALDAGIDAPVADVGIDVPPPDPVAAEAPYTQYVNPFFATGGLGFGVGSGFPGPQMPFGLARPSPDTALEGGAPGFNHCAGYHDDDNLIWGFSQARAYGVGVEMYGSIGLMPVDGMTADKIDQLGHASEFQKENENAEVGYYSVLLDNTQTQVEITSADRVGIYQLTFGEAVETPTVLIDVGHTIGALEIVEGGVEVDAEAREIRGYARWTGTYGSRIPGGQPVYFAARFDVPFANVGVWDGDGLRADETTASGSDNGAWVELELGDDRMARVDVAISFTETDKATMNLAETEGQTFDDVRAANVAAWEEALSRFEIEARSQTDLRQFYTAVYRALFMPTLASDIDGSYRGFDGEIHNVDEGGRYYTDFSLWDTFRSQVPFLTLFFPELLEDQLDSMMRMAREGGYMPRWPMGIGYTGGMVGDSANLMFADAWMKNVRTFDVAEAYSLFRRTAFGPTPDGAPYGGRSGIQSYMDNGYVSMQASGSSTSRTLEFAYNDWGLAELAEAAGETEDAAILRERANNWRNTWDESVQFFVGRNDDGSFVPLEDPLAWQDYFAEGNVWQYVWYVPHDMDGLAELMGGREAILSRLDGFFADTARRPMTLFPGHFYWHGNEPDIHTAWMYSWYDRPDDSARWVRWITRQYYSDGPEGLPGNDDSGTLSAWLAFAYLGFYPITGWDEYLVAAPMVTQATVHLPGGDLVIEAPNASDERYVREAFNVNGTERETSRITHAEIVDGATLNFDLR